MKFHICVTLILWICFCSVLGNNLEKEESKPAEGDAVAEKKWNYREMIDNGAIPYSKLKEAADEEFWNNLPMHDRRSWRRKLKKEERTLSNDNSTDAAQKKQLLDSIITELKKKKSKNALELEGVIEGPEDRMLGDDPLTYDLAYDPYNRVRYPDRNGYYPDRAPVRDPRYPGYYPEAPPDGPEVCPCPPTTTTTIGPARCPCPPTRPPWTPPPIYTTAPPPPPPYCSNERCMVQCPVGEKGNQGPPGFPGVDGSFGPKGQKGEPGYGGGGRVGPPGEPGLPGKAGIPGTAGPPGPTEIGPPGPKGFKGDQGYPGNPGVKGDRGQDGCQGPPGPRGIKGEPGDRGFPPPATIGPKGNKGDRGYPGPKGETPPPPRDGRKGDKGEPGSSGSSYTAPSMCIYARHSQTEVVPECPIGHTRLWTGYSLAHTDDDDGASNVQDLGRSGSCVENFQPVPFMTCIGSQPCDLPERSSTAYWLHSELTAVDGVQGDRRNGYRNLLRYVSRCAVCEGSCPLFARHETEPGVRPTCPPGYTQLWNGYSMIMHAIGCSGGGQDLESPGSCMESYRSNMVLKCDGKSECTTVDDKALYWLMMTNADRAGRDESKIGKCVVCSRGTPVRYPPGRP